MLRSAIVVFIISNSARCALDYRSGDESNRITSDERSTLKFPEAFKFGVATAAYQIEGAWNVDGRTPSVWDEYVHTQPNRIADRSTGDVACDSYHLWERDVEMVSELGLDFYRFSISWTRLFPNGFTNYVNEDGKKYYSNLIDALIDKGIQPVITLFHWDLPQKFQDLGGWTNPLISEWIAEYARAVYTLYADRVSIWMTINEPLVLCDMVYQSGLYAPGILSPGIGNYICTKNVLIAHAKAWRIYDQEFKQKYNGKVGIVNNHLWLERTAGVSEEEAEMARNLFLGIYTYPIYSEEGGWPPMLEKYIAKKSAHEGYQHSRLPALSKKEKEFIKGTYDFYGMNYYTARLIRKPKRGEKIGPWPLEGSSELNLVLFPDPKWRVSSANWLYVYAKGLRHELKRFKQQFGDVEILIAENGYANEERNINDLDRVQYYKEHLEQVLLSIHEDHINLIGYSAWSLMDNFEWYNGYAQRFGLYAVDFTSPKRTRTPRSSARYYASVIEHHSLNFNFTVTSGGSTACGHKYSIAVLVLFYLCLFM